MDVDIILDGIRKKEHQEIAKIESEAEKKISQIHAKTKQEAESQKNRILSDGRIKFNRDKALIEQQAEMQALKIHADARQNLIEQVLNQVRESFQEVRKRDDYSAILGNLIDETLETIKPSLLDESKILLHIDKKDIKLAEEIVGKLDDQIVVVDDLNIAGGCLAETDDRMVSVKNTLDSRFLHVEDQIRQDLSLFFEEQVSSN